MNQKNSCLYDTDDVAVRIFNAMSSDFVKLYGRNLAEPAMMLSQGLSVFRDYSYPDYRTTSVPRFKAWYQLESMLKKYIFQSDALTDQQRHEATVRKYLDFQVRRAVQQPLTHRANLVLREARRICQKILGKFDPEVVFQNCRFGRNSSIGCSFANSYLDYKLSTDAAFTGSCLTTKAFCHGYLPSDHVLARILRRNGLQHVKQVESLSLVLVPKTWKVLRAITPLSLLSLHRSYGIGAVVTERLEAIGLDIAHLQSRHARLVKRFSISRSHVTADLSSASDSITSWMLNSILPRDWYVALRETLTHRLNIDSVEYYTESVLPMGNGSTFPIETLIFYSLIKAIGNLANIDGIFSVYGDDLIYPRRLHRFVVAVFNDLGIEINKDKTFVESKFRESCGTDSYAGVDVRPFFLPGGGRLTKSKYVAWLYTALNALCRRWSYDETPAAYTTLLIELSHVAGEILRVPPSYPDTAGFKLDISSQLPSVLSFLPWAPILVRFQHGTRHYVFSYLKQSGSSRVVKDVEPYYWQKLRSMVVDEVDNPHALPKTASEVLTWRRIKSKKTFYDGQGRKRVKTFVKHIALIADKQKVRYQRCTIAVKPEIDPLITDWI